MVRRPPEMLLAALTEHDSHDDIANQVGVKDGMKFHEVYQNETQQLRWKLVEYFTGLEQAKAMVHGLEAVVAGPSGGFDLTAAGFPVLPADFPRRKAPLEYLMREFLSKHYGTSRPPGQCTLTQCPYLRACIRWYEDTCPIWNDDE